MYDDVRDLYQSVILDRSRAPRHSGRLAAFDATARGDNPMCGDRVQIWLKQADDGTVAAVGYEARGCAISIASADLMADAVAGRSPDAVRRLSAEFGAMVHTGHCQACDEGLDALKPLASVHEFPSRMKCATLAWDAMVAALDGPKETRHG